MEQGRAHLLQSDGASDVGMHAQLLDSWEAGATNAIKSAAMYDSIFGNTISPVPSGNLDDALLATQQGLAGNPPPGAALANAAKEEQQLPAGPVQPPATQVEQAEQQEQHQRSADDGSADSQPPGPIKRGARTPKERAQATQEKNRRAQKRFRDRQKVRDLEGGPG